MEPRLLNVKELSAYLSMPTATVYAYVGRGKFPSDCIRRIGRSLKFDKQAVDRWVSGGTLSSPGESFPPSKIENAPTSGKAQQDAA